MAKSTILQPLIKALGSNIYRFEKEIGVPRGRISKAIDQQSKLSIETISMIVEKYPQVNREWLLTGKGNMFTEPQLPVKKEYEELITGVPYDVMMKLAGRTEEPQPHEGHMLKAYIKGRGFVMEQFARNEMGMTEQNMYKYLREPVLNADFRMNAEKILGIDFYRDVMGKSKKSILEKIDTESFRELMYELFTRIEKLENQL